MKQAVDNLYEIFKSITDIDINNLNEGDILLPTGKAISPSAAAHCLLEMKRTAIFLRGIKKAIDQKLENLDRAINILYAGCGPYGTLITPLLTLYSSDEIKITFLDINQISLNAVEKLVTNLGYENFIEDYVLEDASNYKINKDYDIVISETMQACLQNEPQVSIMQNLIPQLNEHAIFIPQQITIDAYLKNPGKWNDKKQQRTGIESKILKALFSVNKTNLDTNHFKEIVQIPENLNGFIELMLHTTIIIFKDEILGVNDCSLNSPRKFYEFKERYANSIEFWYSLLPQPSIECRVLDFVEK
ncbi:MAG: hypothetical protein JEY96_05935 [Bacteroidales bacterium]|nr:hypothetical protein [Bacteroidales bacterium]